MTTNTLTPEQKQAIQSYICEQALLWQQLQRTIPGIALASMHISPDSAWVSIEHEEVQLDDSVANALGSESPTQVVRMSPACHILVTKI